MESSRGATPLLRLTDPSTRRFVVPLPAHERAGIGSLGHRSSLMRARFGLDESAVESGETSRAPQRASGATNLPPSPSVSERAHRLRQMKQGRGSSRVSAVVARDTGEGEGGGSPAQARTPRIRLRIRVTSQPDALPEAEPDS